MNDILHLISTRKPGVHEEDIIATEEKLGLIFPTQYRELCKLVNNAEIGEWTLYPIHDPRNPKKTWDDIVRQNNETRLPENLIAIGDDGSGDLLCLKGTNGNTIYLWDHETEEIEEYASDLRDFIFSAAEDE